jgi:hypothetical protein
VKRFGRNLPFGSKDDVIVCPSNRPGVDLRIAVVDVVVAANMRVQELAAHLINEWRGQNVGGMTGGAINHATVQLHKRSG